MRKRKCLILCWPVSLFLNSGYCLRIGESDTSESESAGFPFLISGGCCPGIGADEGETSEEPSLGLAANCARHLSTIQPLTAQTTNNLARSCNEHFLTYHGLID